MLQLDSALVAGLFAPEEITARQPGADEHALAAAAYAAIPFDAPLYARIDMIRDDRGVPVILELEMTEPSVFLRHAPGSAERLAAAADRALQRLEPARDEQPEHVGVEAVKLLGARRAAGA